MGELVQKTQFRAEEVQKPKPTETPIAPRPKPPRPKIKIKCSYKELHFFLFVVL